MNSTCINIESATGAPLVARLVLPGMGYGRWDQGHWAMVHDKADPMIEFYDQRDFHGVYGYFVSRYYFSTLDHRQGPGRYGLLLDTGSQDWSVSGQAMTRVLDHFRPTALEVRTHAEKGLRILLATRDNTLVADGQSPVLYGPDDLCWPVLSLDHASNLVQQYAAVIGFGESSWIGGRVEDVHGNYVADVDFRGKVCDSNGVTLRTPAHARDYQAVTAEAFFKATETCSRNTMPERLR
jgi:hypothetical protein